MNFPCTKCGACCCNVGHVIPLRHLGWVGDDGVCAQYDSAERKCRVYETRPMICRIDEGRPERFSVGDWTELNINACDLLHLKMYGEARERDGACSHSVKE